MKQVAADDERADASASSVRRRVLFIVEGFTDIRFVASLSEISDLTMVVPAREYHSSGLAERVNELALRIEIIEVQGGRAAFQVRSMAWLLLRASRFEVILAQEVLRGALNANIAGRLRRVPVITYMGIAPVEYFRCRRERGRIGRVKAVAGEAVIRAMLAVNGRLATRCLAMGPYLREVAARYCPRSAIGLYYGVDTERFRPADETERFAVRTRLGLPRDRFLVLFSSRVSHEKDPETVIRAAADARRRGLDATLLNLGGGWREFIALARSLGVSDCDDWVMGRPAVHPMTAVFDYFRAADAVAMASIAEGAAFSTLEALACATPTVATAVGGMAVQLDGFARLVPRGDARAMADALLWIAAHPGEARAQATRGRDYVIREWERARAFSDLRGIIEEIAGAEYR